MEINKEGHILVTPREVCDRLDEPARLINDVLIPGTPRAFPSYRQYCDFLASCADLLGVHPRNIVIRGSAKVGFSVTPDPERVWMEMRADSDVDLAIVDPDYYHYFDREIRMYERDPANNVFQGPQFRKSIARRDQRRFYTYRYFDLPDIGCVAEHNANLKALPVEQCCGQPRPVDAFVFRDWWSLYSRWEFDLRDLRRAIAAGLQRGGERPRSSLDIVDHWSSHNADG
jgi:hypothetical protein